MDCVIRIEPQIVTGYRLVDPAASVDHAASVGQP
jgi:hypothetical protein